MTLAPTTSAWPAAYLATPYARWLTGSTLYVDAGPNIMGETFQTGVGGGATMGGKLITRRRLLTSAAGLGAGVAIPAAFRLKNRGHDHGR